MTAVETECENIKTNTGKVLKKIKLTTLSCQKCSLKFKTLFSLRTHAKFRHLDKKIGKGKIPYLKENFNKECFTNILADHDREGIFEKTSFEESESYQKKEKMGKSLFYPLVGTELSSRPWKLLIEKYI